MKIDSVHYSRKASDGRYGNAELGMHAQIEDGEDPEYVAQCLQTIVTGTLIDQSQAAQRSDEAHSRDYDLSQRIGQKQNDLERMEKQWVLAKAFLEQHGVDTSRYTDVPF